MTDKKRSGGSTPAEALAEAFVIEKEKKKPTR